MNNDTSKFVVAATGVTVALVAVTANYVKVIKTERARRKKIDEDLQLDLTAIRLAGERMQAKVRAGDYDGQLYRMFDDMSNEIEFQKITIRES
jgi:hypothetical protein